MKDQTGMATLPDGPSHVRCKPDLIAYCGSRLPLSSTQPPASRTLSPQPPAPWRKPGACPDSRKQDQGEDETREETNYTTGVSIMLHFQNLVSYNPEYIGLHTLAGAVSSYAPVHLTFRLTSRISVQNTTGQRYCP